MDVGEMVGGREGGGVMIEICKDATIGGWMCTTSVIYKAHMIGYGYYKLERDVLWLFTAYEACTST